MTALPDPTSFVALPKAGQNNGYMQRPNVVEHYWGYEVSCHEEVINLAALMRGFAVLVTFASFAAALLVWLLPASAFVGDAMVVKSMASLLFWCVGGMLMRFVPGGTNVRIQVDTSAGELREVVDGMTGKVVVLARYGFDAAVDVGVVASREDAGNGQVQIMIAEVGRIPAGNGDIRALHDLRARLANDLGTAAKDPRRPIWSGPIKH